MINLCREFGFGVHLQNKNITVPNDMLQRFYKIDIRLFFFKLYSVCVSGKFDDILQINMFGDQVFEMNNHFE